MASPEENSFRRMGCLTLIILASGVVGSCVYCALADDRPKRTFIGKGGDPSDVDAQYRFYEGIIFNKLEPKKEVPSKMNLLDILNNREYKSS